MISNPAFFLGGYDLEMVTIRDLIADAAGTELHDRRLRWGAKASHYGDEIAEAMTGDRTPVLVELENDLGLPAVDATAIIGVQTEMAGGRRPEVGVAGRAIVVDHHGEGAGADAPTSLEQVFDLLGLPPERWTRWLDLVAANDRGYITELRAIGATDEEIRRVRAADRAAQGITPAEEEAAASAVRSAELRCGGALLVIRLPHSRTAAATDRVELEGNAPENILVLSPHEANFYGRGDVVSALASRYAASWSGGALPFRGFWGISPVPSGIESTVEEQFAKVKSPGAP